MHLLCHLIVYEIRRRNTVGDINAIWRRLDEICMPGNEGRNTNTVILFSIYCFISDCKYITWRHIDAICYVQRDSPHSLSGIMSSSYAAIDFRISCCLHDA
jgi:hypothetical protein